MYGHGFYWKTERSREYTVVFDFEINSHSRIKKYRTIPAEAIRIGFNPVDGTAMANDFLPLPLEVKEKIEILFEAYYPNPKTIAEWIRNNYGKQDDRKEWELPLLHMLDDGGAGLLSAIYCEERIKDCEQGIKDYEGWIKVCKWRIKDCEKWSEDDKETKLYKWWIKDYEERIKVYEQGIKDCKQGIKNYEQGTKDCTGTLTEMEIDKFIPYFLSHPNAFWAQRCEKRKIEYKSFVTA